VQLNFRLLSNDFNLVPGLELVLKETAAASHIASREARINMILRKMQLRNGSLLGIDLTSSEEEREVRHKQIEAQLRLRELDKSCQEGWAHEAQESLDMVNIYEVKLNINLNAQTLEQLNESRKVCMYVSRSCRALLHVVLCLASCRALPCFLSCLASNLGTVLHQSDKEFSFSNFLFYSLVP
jgi:hypothetical protein